MIAASANIKLQFKRGDEVNNQTYKPHNLSGVYAHPIGSGFMDSFNGTEDEDGDKLEITSVGIAPDYILVFEKKGPMQEAILDGILAKKRCILVCAEGNPSHGTLACVKVLHNLFPLADIIGGGDLGPIGVEIISRYYWTRSFGFKFSVPIKWGFLLPTDKSEPGTVERTKRGWTKADYQADTRLLNSPWMRHFNGAVERLAEYNKLRDTSYSQERPNDHVKYECNGFKPIKNDGTSIGLGEFFENKLNTFRFL